MVLVIPQTRLKSMIDSFRKTTSTIQISSFSKLPFKLRNPPFVISIVLTHQFESLAVEFGCVSKLLVDDCDRSIAQRP